MNMTKPFWVGKFEIRCRADDNALFERGLLLRTGCLDVELPDEHVPTGHFNRRV